MCCCPFPIVGIGGVSARPIQGGGGQTGRKAGVPVRQPSPVGISVINPVADILRRSWPGHPPRPTLPHQLAQWQPREFTADPSSVDVILFGRGAMRYFKTDILSIRLEHGEKRA